LLSPRVLIMVSNDVAGFVRYGNANHSGLACLISNGGRSRKRMFIGRRYTNTQWIDILGHHDMQVVIDKRGYGNFPINASSVGVWVEATAVRRDLLEKKLYAK
jgi:alpha-amylase